MNIMIDNNSGITLIIESAIYLFLLIYIKRKKKCSNTYVLFFSIFYVYICNLVGFTLFPIILSETMRRDIGQNIFECINMTPLITLKIKDFKTSYYNVLLTIPFGFGISFVTKSNFNLMKISLLGLAIGISIEAL